MLRFLTLALPAALLVLAAVDTWFFRGPLLVASVALLTRLPVAPLWQAARIGLVALPAAGLAVGLHAALERTARTEPTGQGEP